MRIFISGPMSGHRNHNRHAFKHAAHLIRQARHTPLNPYNPSQVNAGYSWAENMLTALNLLAHADAITTLPGADKSPGSCIEQAFAKAAGIPYLPLETIRKTAKIAETPQPKKHRLLEKLRPRKPQPPTPHPVDSLTGIWENSAPPGIDSVEYVRALRRHLYA